MRMGVRTSPQPTGYLEYHFERTGGSVARLSAAVGMERTHLYRKQYQVIMLKE